MCDYARVINFCIIIISINISISIIVANAKGGKIEVTSREHQMVWGGVSLSQLPPSPT